MHLTLREQALTLHKSMLARVARFSKSAQKRLQTILVIGIYTQSHDPKDDRGCLHARLAKRHRNFSTIA